ncbi:MAG: lysophospholipid acyltransferase family protein [Victivallales bacterium]|nr:lysophospholipid acyltransferase family protein [Victivallales bacterium]
MGRRIFTFKNKRKMPGWLAFLAAWLIRFVAWTYRVSIESPKPIKEFVEDKEPCVVAIWHNRLLFIPALVPKSILQKCTVLISASRDGEYIARFIRFFGLNVVRGSSSRGAAGALIRLIHSAKEGLNPVLTVDGPRGPKYCVHPGAVAIATRQNLKIVPIVLNAPRKWQLKSWDRMQIPWPFSKVKLVLGEPFMIPSGMPIEEACDLLKKHLLDITDD